MRKIMNRLNKKEGFTLAELLIVVAIIAVLVAVSIPIFTGRLEKAREATDVANLRAAYAAGVAEYLGATEDFATDPKVRWYDAQAGQLVVDKPTTGCLKGTTADGGGSANIGGFAYAASGTNYSGKSIKVSIASTGVVTLSVE